MGEVETRLFIVSIFYQLQRQVHGMYKKKDLEHIQALHSEFPKRIDFQNSLAKNKRKNHDFRHTESLANEWYLWAVCVYMVDHDVEVYRQKAIEALKCLRRVLNPHQAGKKVSLLRHWYLVHRQMSLALSVNAIGFAKELCGMISEMEYETKMDTNPFHQYWTLSIKCLLLDQKELGLKFCEQLNDEFSKKSYRAYLPYAIAIKAIWGNDSYQLIESLKALSKTYSKQCGDSELFPFIENRFFSEYGIALIYLARSRGMVVEYEGDYFPSDLLNLPEITTVEDGEPGFIKSIMDKLFR